MQATLGFLQHYAPDASSLRALIVTLLAQARAHAMQALHSLRPADDLGSLDAHVRRDIGLGEFGAADIQAVRTDLVRG